LLTLDPRLRQRAAEEHQAADRRVQRHAIDELDRIVADVGRDRHRQRDQRAADQRYTAGEYRYLRQSRRQQQVERAPHEQYRGQHSSLREADESPDLLPRGTQQQHRERSPRRHVEQQGVQHERKAQHRQRPLRQEKYLPRARRGCRDAGQ
jgi:hypothetical protein